jgi:hypothetical protein
VLIVARNVKFPSNLTAADRYTAENAILNEEEQEDIKLTKASIYRLSTILFLFLSSFDVLYYS